jgi:ABC-type multidrug transport system ATPase subunit
MPKTVVDVRDLSKSFGKNAIFERCDLSLEEGSVFGLVGLNGTGKTTLIRLLLGLLKPDGGTVSVLGFDPWRHRPEYYRRLGVMLDHDGFAGNLTVAQNLRIFASAKGIGFPQVESYVEGFWKDTFIARELTEGRKKVKFLSRGQKVQCAMCRAFLSWPSVYFLDEPTVSLDVDAYDHFCMLVRHASSLGATVIISSHQLSAIEELCAGVGMLHDKNVTLLKSGDETGLPKQWLVRCDRNEEYGKAMEAICGFPALYEGGAWHIQFDGTKDPVPEIISRLVAMGCRISEVRPETDSIKERIRSRSQDSKSGGAV